MSTYKPPSPDRPIEELRAGDAFRDSVLGRADRVEGGGYPLWHGWVIMDAFLAGIDWARAQEEKRTADKVADLRAAYGDRKD